MTTDEIIADIEGSVHPRAALVAAYVLGLLYHGDFVDFPAAVHAAENCHGTENDALLALSRLDMLHVLQKQFLADGQKVSWHWVRDREFPHP